MDWLKEKILALFAPKYIGAVVRGILQILAGYLIKLGIPQAQIDALLAALDPVLMGVATAVITIIWSLIQKKKNSD